MELRGVAIAKGRVYVYIEDVMRNETTTNERDETMKTKEMVGRTIEVIDCKGITLAYKILKVRRRNGKVKFHLQTPDRHYCTHTIEENQVAETVK